MNRRKIIFSTRDGEQLEFTSVREAAKAMHICNNTIYKRVDDQNCVFRNGKAYRIRFQMPSGVRSREIIWHPYPQQEPSENEFYFLTCETEASTVVTFGRWLIDEFIFLETDGTVTAWAEMPEPFRVETWKDTEEQSM